MGDEGAAGRFHWGSGSPKHQGSFLLPAATTRAVSVLKRRPYRANNRTQHAERPSISTTQRCSKRLGTPRDSFPLICDPNAACPSSRRRWPGVSGKALALRVDSSLPTAWAAPRILHIGSARTNACQLFTASLDPTARSASVLTAASWSPAMSNGNARYGSSG